MNDANNDNNSNKHDNANNSNAIIGVTLRLYKNAALVQTCLVGTSPPWGGGSAPIVLGGDGTSSSAFFDGVLDEVHVSGRSLSAPEVAASVGALPILRFEPGSGAGPLTAALAGPPPAGATHLLAYALTAGGARSRPAAVPYLDTVLPTHPALGVNFSDAAPGPSVYGGEVYIVASGNADTSHYLVYWGQDATHKLLGTAALAVVPLMDIGLDSGNESLVGAGSVVAAWFAPAAAPAAATHLVVVAAHGQGASLNEMASGVGLPLVDYNPPAAVAAGLDFEDTDTLYGQIGGTQRDPTPSNHM